MFFAPVATGPTTRLLKSATVSAAAEAIIGDFNEDYRIYLVLFENLQSSSDGDTLNIRVSTDNGSTFDSGAGNYAYNSWVHDDTNTFASGGSAAATEIVIRSSFGTASIAEQNTCGRLYIYSPLDSGQYTKMWLSCQRVSSAGTTQYLCATGQREAQQADNAIKLFWSTGNITLRYDLYGIK